MGDGSKGGQGIHGWTKYGIDEATSEPSRNSAPLPHDQPIDDRPLADSPLGNIAAPYVLLEDRLAPEQPALLFRDPASIVRCDNPQDLDKALDRVQAGLDRGLHAAGLLSYELGHALEPRLASIAHDRSKTPLLWFGLFEAPRRVESRHLDAAFASLAPPPPIRALGPAHDPAEHMSRVRKVLDLIAAGDIYQANLTFPMRFRFDGNPLALYGALRGRQPVAHGGFAALVDFDVLSVSPELWVEVVDGRATTRPMKGTAARGSDPTSDEAATRELAACPKQRAENLMIVDLLRNDLARICEAGTVAVPALFTMETYPSLHTLTSTVTGVLRRGLSLREKLAALFPCGSIVGAPKIRASEIIADLELWPRGVYTGALGRIAPNGDMVFNVAIRTAVIAKDGRGVYGVGGGIVADSDPAGEYAEALLKAKVLADLSQEYGLVETFRWAATEGFVRLSMHLDRLTQSAAAMGFDMDRSVIHAELARVAREVTGKEGDTRVRLLLRRNGKVEISASRLAPAAPGIGHARVSDHRVDPADPYLRHKTTQRALYDSEFDKAIEMGLDEAIFLNRRGEVAEASRHSIFVRIGGRLITPPLACGLLPGVLRRSLLESGEAFEGVLTPDDLRQVGALFLGNSLRGLCRFALVDA